MSVEEEEGLILRSGQIAQRPPRPMRGVKNRRLGGRKDDNVTETKGEDQAITEAEGEEMTGAVGGTLSETEIQGIQEQEFKDIISSDEERSKKERRWQQ